MKVGVATSSATEALFSNPMRSLLTMLGIIIGVASVMVLQGLVSGGLREEAGVLQRARGQVYTLGGTVCWVSL